MSKRFLRDNGLSIVLFTLFLFFLGGQALTGWNEYNSEQRDHREPTVSLRTYLTTGHFGEAVFENWESEFLQMSSYVLLTIWFRQRGSAESKSMSKRDEVERDPLRSNKRNAPWPVRRGGWILRIYENSLSVAFVLLFLSSFALHGVGGAQAYNKEQREHGEPTVALGDYMSTSRFWYESFQNWQSEFLATGSIVLLTVFLRQRGSPESKPVDMTHGEMQQH